MNTPMINKDSKKGDRVMTVNRLGQQRVVKLKATPLFNAEGQLVGCLSPRYEVAS